MELIKKKFTTRIKTVAEKISNDNLFMLASSISYYSALALAPFVLILLSIASLLGADVQKDIVLQVKSTFSYQVGELMEMLFKNINQGVNLSSISGIIGAVVLLSTASMVFLQFRYSFDVIYGYYSSLGKKSNYETVKEKLFAMCVVLATAVLFILSLIITGLLLKTLGGEGNTVWASVVVFGINFLMYFGIFTGIHTFVPTRRPEFRTVVKIAALTAVFFMLGNIVLAVYLKQVAADSIYGAAGSLLVFLTWAYYSSFTIFLSVEVFIYLKKIGKIK